MLTSIYDSIISQLQSNDMLVAGVGTVVLATLMALLRKVPSLLWTNIKKFFTVELSIRSSMKNYNRALDEISKNKAFFTRVFTEENGRVENGYGKTYSFYNGRLCIVDRSMLEKQTSHVEEMINITFISRSKKILEDFIFNINTKENKETLSLYYNSGLYGFSHREVLKRNLDTVFIDKELKETLIKRINWFLNNKEWYIKRGIPYKLSLLIHGEPGTGKTSIVKALASYFNKNIYYVNSLKAFDEIPDDFSEKNDIILIEDLDRIIGESKKENYKGKEKEGTFNKGGEIHKFLNGIDGLKVIEGNIFIFTANDISKIDKALLREGRIDLNIEIPKIEDEIIKEMLLNFFNMSEFEGLNDIKFKPSTGARVQDCIIKSSSIEEAINNIISEKSNKK